MPQALRGEQQPQQPRFVAMWWYRLRWWGLHGAAICQHGWWQLTGAGISLGELRIQRDVRGNAVLTWSVLLRHKAHYVV